jgi:hypothetical protein
MWFSFPCPHCRRSLGADSQRAGAMMRCKECLVAFPVPEMAPAPVPVMAAPQEHAVNIFVGNGSGALGWRLVSLGLSLLVASMVALLAAGVIALGAVVVIGGRAFNTPLFFPGKSVLILAFFGSLAALVTACLGVALCGSTPASRWLRICARASVAFMLPAGAAGAIALAVGDGALRHVPFATIALLMFATLCAIASLTFWALFLQGLAHFFDDRALANGAGSLLAVSGVLLMWNLVVLMVLPPAALAVPLFLYVWHLKLVIRVRRRLAFGMRHFP